ncbi:MAG: acyl-CoA dehydrogenase [Alphaproteobacteria bacterium]|nr:acyl-CoA dehydrogenase [Alphaproteobacteria bacterium]
MTAFRFPACTLPPEAEALRAEVRAFASAALRDVPEAVRARGWAAFDADFSRRLGERGWIGMTWPKRYGGREKSMLERYVVLEELLAAGAPVSAHWIADRQSGPLILRFGSEEQRRFFLPRIASGQCFFCIGMSEPDVGSDLASVRSRARPVDGGWRLSGSKIWTSNAHQAHYMIALVRTSGEHGMRHAGLSQVIVDLKAPGVSVRPIKNLVGEAHFNQVHFDDVTIPADRLVGAEGQGWDQVVAELAYERSGPERYLSAFRLCLELARRAERRPDDAALAEAVGRMVAELATLRRMSLSVAGLLQAGQNPAQEAALVKELGTTFEQAMPRIAHALSEDEVPPATVEGYLTLAAPSFSLRGGTREILRGIIARGLGLR